MGEAEIHRGTESCTIREPRRDIAAQIACLLDPAHPKKAVYIAGGENEWPNADGAFLSFNGGGVFLTTDFRLFQWFDHLETVTDEHLARALGYPESKGAVVEHGGDVMVIQARTPDDCVIFEACCSDKGRNATVEAVRAQIPPGGRMVFTTLADALKRRIAEM